MRVDELAVRDAFVFTPDTFPDHRGMFVAPFQQAVFRETRGHCLSVAQTNHSVSRRGTVRGIHFADTPPGQAKYVYCPRGALLDVVVDLRIGSPTFGNWDAVRLDDSRCRAVYIAEGLGHGFAALQEETTMTYLCSTPYDPPSEHAVNAFDPELDLPWPTDAPVVTSEKDAAAPTLASARSAGTLPDYQTCLAYYAQLRNADH